MRGWLRPPAIAFFASLLVAVPAGASAQPSLVGATPAQGASVAATDTLQLDFSEPVSASASKVDLVMTAMPGMANMPPMRMAVKVAPAGGGRSLLLTARAPLPIGSYTLTWTTAGANKSKATGNYDFTVRQPAA